tara:strand:+ start:7666 stop:8916 length:1251 start_codon:yes stop_codon:yes gene_type:complete
MGNINSNEKKSLYEVTDYIASNYILTNSFEDLRNLLDIKYCNDLVILTSDVLERNLNMAEVNYLSQRIHKGNEINSMKKENIIFLTKDHISDIDVNNLTKKKRICKGIAKFYIKVAHLFAAIVTTVNPLYSYNDGFGEKFIDLMKKNKVNKKIFKTVLFDNICTRRINALMKNVDLSGNNIVIEPGFCKMNRNPKTYSTKTLYNEPGIPELSKLYYDKYNFNTGKFSNMSNTMKKTYKRDVKTFYKEFTGNKKVPSHINKFSDIPLRNYHKLPECHKNGLYNNTYSGTTKNFLFRKYANHVKKMMQETEKNQKKLITILDELFIVDNQNTTKKNIIINPNLTYTKLQTLVEKSRNPIIQSYISCEQDFLKGLEIFEAIVETQILQTTKQQMITLKKDASTIQFSNDSEILNQDVIE